MVEEGEFGTIVVKSPKAKAGCGSLLICYSLLYYAVLATIMLHNIDFCSLCIFYFFPSLAIWSGIYLIHTKNKPNLILDEEQIRLCDCFTTSIRSWRVRNVKYSDICGWYVPGPRELYLKKATGDFISFDMYAWDTEDDLRLVIEILERKGVKRLPNWL
jgi:hypothetical protein